MHDNLQVTFLAHDCILSKTKDVEAFKKIFNVVISTIKVGRQTWYKINLCIFTLASLVLCLCFPTVI